MLAVGVRRSTTTFDATRTTTRAAIATTSRRIAVEIAYWSLTTPMTTGTIDNNVHPANTYRMAKALIEAGKRFDLFVFPGQRHGYGSMDDYWFWLRAEYFAEHLLNDGRDGPDVTPLQEETPASDRP